MADPDEPSAQEAAAFWNGLTPACRHTLLDGYDGEHPWALLVQLEEGGMLLERAAAPDDRVVQVAEEGQPAGRTAPATGLDLVLARELVRILDRGSADDVAPQGL